MHYICYNVEGLTVSQINKWSEVFRNHEKGQFPQSEQPPNYASDCGHSPVVLEFEGKDSAYF
jgi:hypothetical protein